MFVERKTGQWCIRYIRKDFLNTRPRGRKPKRWTDIMRRETGLPLLTAGRNASDRNGWRRRNVKRTGGQLI